MYYSECSYIFEMFWDFSLILFQISSTINIRRFQLVFAISLKYGLSKWNFQNLTSWCFLLIWFSECFFCTFFISFQKICSYMGLSSNLRVDLRLKSLNLEVFQQKSNSCNKGLMKKDIWRRSITLFVVWNYLKIFIL